MFHGRPQDLMGGAVNHVGGEHKFVLPLDRLRHHRHDLLFEGALIAFQVVCVGLAACPYQLSHSLGCVVVSADLSDNRTVVIWNLTVHVALEVDSENIAQDGSSLCLFVFRLEVFLHRLSGARVASDELLHKVLHNLVVHHRVSQPAVEIIFGVVHGVWQLRHEHFPNKTLVAIVEEPVLRHGLHSAFCHLLCALEDKPLQCLVMLLAVGRGDLEALVDEADGGAIDQEGAEHDAVDVECNLVLGSRVHVCVAQDKQGHS
mmetsp:Transcript_22710/g.49918  ORF Transcript_22710/g.49918 Transcript_22710/m.49918 type:complete len:260 (+) Transcript_22710:838-1617(+)